ncbi:MAG: archaeal proteasome endopeptidase complex subunit beta [Desulfurococcaceae archaeon]|nr:archaeal proteasome endopeptidase complex subunit beta [Desulfurococcaceae archaeon]MCC6052602.1 archaeal proteasome endopeptidase complex subunit beta [Desulfurococcaceae archaeon]
MSLLLPGTAVGLKTRDGVVLATDKRVTYDGFVLSKQAKKVYMITGRTGVAFAGLLGDVGYLTKLLKLESKYYELKVGRDIKTRSLAKVLSLVLYNYKLFPMFTEIIVGGYDEEGASLFILDPVGSLIEEKYAAVGSGAQLALGYIEPKYREDLTLEEAEKIAVEAIKTVIERDVLSGDGVDLVVITREGYTEKSHLFKTTPEK